jgi:uncharacterized damage-inducible protein DinB
MPLSDALLPEFDQEMTNTRKTLARVADERLAWRPHPKSLTMGELATHLASILDWAALVIEKPSVPVDGPEAPPRPMPVTSRNELLQRFDRSLGAARAAIADASDTRLLESWSLIAGGRPVFTQPRLAVLRGFVMNHGIHHRGQLGVYLRLNGIPVPALYGPSADEAMA